jgi:glycosyltransferase involved in cell wall biosynthesis
MPYTTLDDKRFFLSAVRHLCNTADHIVTVSEKSKADIVALTGMSEHRITNTYQAVSVPADLLAQSEQDLAQVIERRFGLGYQEYFLFCGALEPKKNLSRLLTAYAESGSDYPLLLAGPLGWDYEEILERIKDERFAGGPPSGSKTGPQRMVRRLNSLPYAHLISLMRGARAVVSLALRGIRFAGPGGHERWNAGDYLEFIVAGRGGRRCRDPGRPARYVGALYRRVLGHKP